MAGEDKLDRREPECLPAFIESKRKELVWPGGTGW